VTATSASGAVVSSAALGSAAATDNCPAVSVSSSGIPAGNLFPIGTTTITWTATDASGNTARATQTVTLSYAVCLLYDPTKPAKLGSTIPIKLTLCGADGTDLSAAATVVHAVRLTKANDTVSGTPEDSGSANPDNDFRFDPTLGVSGGYIYNLSTKNLSSGTWSLHFTVNGQGDYTIQFQVK